MLRPGQKRIERRGYKMRVILVSIWKNRQQFDDSRDT